MSEGQHCPSPLLRDGTWRWGRSAGGPLMSLSAQCIPTVRPQPVTQICLLFWALPWLPHHWAVT